MHHRSSAMSVACLLVFVVATAPDARADDLGSSAPARALGRPDIPTPPAAIAVEPRPFAWNSPAEPGPAAEATLVGGCGECRRQLGKCACGADRWRVSLTIPIWVPTVSGQFASGDVNVDGNRKPSGVGGVLDKLLPDAATSFEFAFLGRIHVMKGPWTISADGFYVSLAETLDWKIRDEDTTGTFDGGVVRVYGAWQKKLPLGCGPCAPCLEIGPTLGARLISLDLHVNRANGDDVNRSATWVDPLVGIKADVTFANGASIGVLADYGTVFDGSHSSWSFGAELAWPLGRGGHWFVLAGWTMLGIDYDVGSGSGQFEVNLDLSGPHIGVTYLF